VVNRTAFLAAAVLAVAIVAAIFHAMRASPDAAPGDSPALVTISGQNQGRAVRAAPAGSAAPVTDMPPARIRDALGLGNQARIRNARLFDEKHDIICGEVSRDGFASGFRRFVYVGVAATADIDDGSEAFETRVRDVCKQHLG
jgi:hypothetical protein